jgi:hypothetical protein
MGQSSQLLGFQHRLRKQATRRDYYREVNNVAIEGSITQTKWSHIPIAFSAEDVNLTSFPHIDAMVVTVHIDQWDV